MSERPHLLEFLAPFRAKAGHHPWPRFVVTPETWRDLGTALAEGHLDLLALFANDQLVNAVLYEPETQALALASITAYGGHFPSLGALHPPALRLERAIRDLWGLHPEGSPDSRPWLDHGTWPSSRPEAKAPYHFLPVEGESLHQIPVGPIHAGIIEPGHFRFTASGETVVRLEQRLGYVHKGIERLLEGVDPAHGVRLAGRVSGDSTVAFAFAFARAVEAATGTEPPERAVWLRALMAELERLANHIGDIGAICNDAAYALIHAHCGILREEILQAADACFGHRLMMDRIVPGGVAIDLDAAGAERLRGLVRSLRARMAEIAAHYEDLPSLQDRTVGTGRVDVGLARRWAAGGYVGRASGRAFDVRKALPYPPYDRLTFTIPVRQEGDVNARVWIRLDEIGESLGLVEQILDGLPQGPLAVPVRPCAGEGIGLVEGFRGDVLVWLALAADGRIRRCHPRDPSWFQWPLLEAAIEGNIVADFPLCNKSFNGSYAGHDL
ncbi:nickel-dependent hydrogenase large subunit [Benzoatithermus flavus]|uniref:Nickel-dependent hydrogenase large subunit n=1 Tax=Benzoatithermus flavus TaxID=3108223 RepID=A0ABU8XVE4_9PROT